MKAIVNKDILKVNDEFVEAFSDVVAVEEPLQINLISHNENRPVSITMRTPGHDTELALGFLFTEGILKDPGDVKHAIEKQNLLTIVINEDVNFDLSAIQRNFYTNSSCGVCGKSSIESLKTISPYVVEEPTVQLPKEVILKLKHQLLEKQSLFQRTGSIHAAACFDMEGTVLDLKEDVGRHNALDKLVGSYFKKDQLPLNNKVLLLSGRASFELIQKAYMAGLKFIVAVGAPSSLAIELAREYRMTLIGFLKHNRFNVYSCPENVKMI